MSKFAPSTTTARPSADTSRAAIVLETTARWLAAHEDAGFGCECANPALQIERWGCEMQSFPLTPAASN